MVFFENDKTFHRPVSSMWDIAVTLRSLMSSMGSQCEKRSRFEADPCASCSPKASQKGSEDQAAL